MGVGSAARTPPLQQDEEPHDGHEARRAGTESGDRDGAGHRPPPRRDEVDQGGGRQHRPQGLHGDDQGRTGDQDRQRRGLPRGSPGQQCQDGDDDAAGHPRHERRVRERVLGPPPRHDQREGQRDGCRRDLRDRRGRHALARRDRTVQALGGHGHGEPQQGGHEVAQRARGVAPAPPGVAGRQHERHRRGHDHQRHADEVGRHLDTVEGGGDEHDGQQQPAGPLERPAHDHGAAVQQQGGRGQGHQGDRELGDRAQALSHVAEGEDDQAEGADEEQRHPQVGQAVHGEVGAHRLAGAVPPAREGRGLTRRGCRQRMPVRRGEVRRCGIRGGRRCGGRRRGSPRCWGRRCGGRRNGGVGRERGGGGRGRGGPCGPRRRRGGGDRGRRRCCGPRRELLDQRRQPRRRRAAHHTALDRLGQEHELHVVGRADVGATRQVRHERAVDGALATPAHPRGPGAAVPPPQRGAAQRVRAPGGRVSGGRPGRRAGAERRSWSSPSSP